MHIEVHDIRDAFQGSIEALRGLGDSTEDSGELGAVRYIGLGKHRGPRNLTRVVIEGQRRGKGGRADR